MKKILITGNMGYIGPVLVQHLRKCYPRAKLVGVDLGYFAHCLSTLDQLPERRLDTQIFGDVRALPGQLLEGVDAVVHLAAISNDPMGNRFEAVTQDVNYRAGIAIARAAKSAGVKSFVFASSCSVYGLAEGGPRAETDELNPLTAYARSK
ncbi:MAG: NAD-dependent epimerase/dehydratase family protein, partial [Steroidobacteraceae bacterium]